jgi:hypothetical protein
MVLLPGIISNKYKKRIPGKSQDTVMLPPGRIAACDFEGILF